MVLLLEAGGNSVENQEADASEAAERVKGRRVMGELFDEILEECIGLSEENDVGKICLWAKVYECNKYECPMLAQFLGKRPADMLERRHDLLDQYGLSDDFAEEMA